MFSWLILFAVSWSPFNPASAQSLLPGADGPRVQFLAKPPHQLEIVDIFVHARPEEAARGAVRPNRFPAGTSQLTLDIRVKELRRLGTAIRFEVDGTAGRVGLGDGMFSFARLEQENVRQEEPSGAGRL